MSSVYITPLLTDDGSEAAPAGERGKFTLTANKTYVCILGGAGFAYLSAQLEWDAAIALTVTVEDSNVGQTEVADISTTNGAWIKENPADAYVPVEGAGGTATAATLVVVAGSVGGAMFSMSGSGAARTRLTLAVGATGGVVRTSVHAKEG